MNNSIFPISQKNKFFFFLIVSFSIHSSLIGVFFYFFIHSTVIFQPNPNSLSIEFISSGSGLENLSVLSSSNLPPPSRQILKEEKFLKKSEVKREPSIAQSKNFKHQIQKEEKELHLDTSSQNGNEQASQITSSSQTLTSGKGGGLGEGNFKKNLSQIRTKIEKHKQYPKEAKNKEVEGKVTLSFEIVENGSLKFVEVAKSSGSNLLDQAAKEAVVHSAPLPYYPGPIRLVISFELEE